jgi:hypothetical protein
MTTGVVGVPDDTWVGRQIRIAADAPYYTILEVSGNDLTIDQEYLGETDTGLAYTVFTLGYAMPRDFVIGREVDVRDTNQPFPISYLPWQDITRYDPSLVTYGPPLIYTFLPDEENREPEGTSTVTAESGTNTTTIVCTTLSSSVDDYYNNFVVINTTRGKTSLVTDYDGTTNTMTISPAIDAQTDTDVFYVIDMRAQFMPYPIPNDERSIVIEYLKGFSGPTTSGSTMITVPTAPTTAKRPRKPIAPNSSRPPDGGGPGGEGAKLPPLHPSLNILLLSQSPKPLHN